MLLGCYCFNLPGVSENNLIIARNLAFEEKMNQYKKVEGLGSFFYSLLLAVCVFQVLTILSLLRCKSFSFTNEGLDPFKSERLKKEAVEYCFFSLLWAFQ